MANILKDEKAELVCEFLVLKGYSIREAARRAGVHQKTVMRMVKDINIGLAEDGEPPLSCSCGKELVKHKGWCSDRYKRSPKRQAFMKRWHSKGKIN